VRPAEIADHIVPHRGDVNSSPTLAQHNLDQTSPLSFSIGGYVSASWNGRACKPKEETAWERKENFWESQKPALVERHGQHRVMMRQHVGRQKNAHVVSSAGEGPLVNSNKGSDIVGPNADSFLMNYGSRQGPLQ